VRVLAFDLAPAELKPTLAARLVRLIRASGDHIGTGFLSSVFICEALADQGHLDVAYALLNQKSYPSWLYAVVKGATTIWESWRGISESGKPYASLNHYSPGAVVNFLHRKVAGIEAALPGYKRIRIQPRPGGGLTHARSTFESVYGLIASEWKQADGRMKLDVTVPPNTTASIILPGAPADLVTESGSPLSKAEGILSFSQSGESAVLETGSGSYSFEYPYQ
jgi:alpha-L-rhamnosidase